MSHPVKAYAKVATLPAAQLQHLQQKGLQVPNQQTALSSLKSLGYNRLLIYMRALQDAQKQFVPGTSFEDIVYLYDFDRKLRLLCLDAIERIEVAVRAAICNTLSVQLGPHFYLESHHFNDHGGMREFLAKAGAANSIAVKHYTDTYNRPSFPPLWTVMEAVTFGCVSRLYSNLHIDKRKLVAAEFGYDEKVLVSWLRSINVVRNMCAHHNRLWNASIAVNLPVQATQLKQEWFSDRPRFANRAVVMAALLKRIETVPDWHQRLRGLVLSHQAIKPLAMGFEAGWETRAFWQ